MPFAQLLGLVTERLSAETVTARLDWDARLCTSGGTLHGGTLMSLADCVGAACAFLNLPAGAGTATVESKTNLMRAVRGGAVRATAQPVHVGRSFIVVQTDIHELPPSGADQGGGRLVARTTQTQAVLSPGS
ncbi:PaaI family thioesterase [Streptomyces sp. AJS327]|nr:PaaI family thioesterase [Streptomyces sp. AJS327]